MTLDELLQQAAAAGVSLSIEGQALRVRTSTGSLSHELRGALSQHKAELLALLEQTSAPALPLVPRGERAALLSFAQQRLWLFEQVEAGAGPVYHVPVCVWLDGPLDLPRLERALRRSVARHEVLRTGYAMADGQAIQVPHEAQLLPFDVVDLSGHADAVAAALACATALVRLPFDIATGQVIRVQVLRVAPARVLLAISLHHIAADAWSVALLLREVQQAYLDDRALPALSLQYADACVWQRDTLTPARRQPLLAFWRTALAGAPQLLDLPTDRPRPAQQSFRGAMERFAVSAETVQRARQFGVGQNATLFQVMLAGFQALLFRYTRQDTIVVGSPVAGRTRPELEPLVGFFVNTLALRADLSPDLDFAGLVAQTVQTTLAAYQHQELPFELLVAELAPQRSLAHNPVFQAMFALQSAPLPPTRMGEVIWRHQAVDLGTSKFDWYLSLQECPDGSLAGEWEFASDLFDATSVQRMVAHYLTLLEAALQAPLQALSTLPLLAPDETRRMLGQWNDTALPWPQDQSLLDLFLQQVVRTPDAVAVADATAALSYGELQARALQVAVSLRARGVSLEDRVGLRLDRRVDAVAAMLGVLWAGAAYVALDPAYPPARLQFMAEDAQLACLLDDEALALLLAGAPADASCAPPLPGPHQLAYLIYTSGSTGRPKGILIEHRNAVSLLAWARTVYVTEDLAVTLASTSFCFDLSVFEVFLPLSCGGTVVLAENALSLSGHPWRERITLVNTVPSVMDELVRSATLPSSVKVVNLAGEPLKAALVDQIYACGHVRDVYDLYGPGETTTYSTWVRRRSGGRESIGRPIANTRLYILDAALQPLPVGVPGEIYLGGAGVTRGYLDRPELTAERYLSDPFHPGGRMYRSGDLGRFWSDGEVQYLGRIDNQIKLRGFRIELGEIEQALAACPGVGDSAVHAPVDVASGQRSLVAYYTGQLDAQVLRAELSRQLPNYMVPSAWVQMTVLPRMPNGKLDRQALPLPEATGPAGLEQAPQGPVEHSLAQVWARVLRRQSVGRHENFFQCGGDSILAMQVVGQARAVGLALEPAHLFQAQTVAELALLAEDTRPAVAEVVEAGSAVPLAPVQRWCLAHESHCPAHYAQWLLLAVPQALGPATLERALEAVVAAHPALRLRFERGPQGWRQTFRAMPASMSVQGLDLDAADAQAVRAAASAAIAGIDLGRGPLLTAGLSGAGDGSRWLLLVAHHLVIDGVSWRVVLDDLAVACALIDAGQAPLLAPEPAGWAAWAQRKAGQADLALSDGRFGLMGQAQRARGQFSAQLTAGLLTAGALGRHAGIHELLGEALRSALTTWDAPRAASIDTEHHGRDGELDLSRTVGWFTRLAGSAEVAFNYLGDLDRALPGGPGWRLSATGLTAAADRPRSHGLAVAAWLADGCLHWEIEHDRTRDSDAALVRLQSLWRTQVERLVRDARLPFALHAPFKSNVAALGPASDTQQGILLHTLLAPQGEVYTTRLSVNLAGRPDLGAFRAAWQDVRRRHPALRSCFARDAGGQLLHVVLREPGSAPLGLWGLTGEAPGVDCELVPRGDAGAQLRWRSHHALLDGWSLALVLQDLAAAYLTRCNGQAPPPEPGGLSAPNPHRGTLRHTGLPQSRADAAFWRDEFARCPEPPTLAFLQDGAGSTQRQTACLALKPALAASIRQWSREQRVTLHTLLQGMWAVLLSRLADAPAVIFGGIMSGRGASQQEQAQVGLLMRTVPVVVQVPENEAAADWLRSLQLRHATREQHAHVPLVDMPALAGRARGTTLFDTIFVLENYPLPQALLSGLAGLVAQGVEIDERPHYPLSLIAQEGQALELSVVFDPARLNPAWATRLPERMAALLAQVTASGAVVQALDIVLPDEKKQLLQTWNATAHDWGAPLREATLMDLFERQVARTPQAAALLSEQGALSYSELDARANHLARLLQARGVGPDTLVGVSMERSPELVIALYGILKAGGAYVPLEPDYPAARLAFMRQDVDLTVVVDRALVGQATGMPTPPPRAVGPQHLAYMIYTSGSTGQPKGALNAHAGIVNRLLWMQATFALDESDRVLQKTPMSFDVSVWEFFWPLMAGATLVLAKPGGHLDTGYLSQLIEDLRVTTLHFVPSMLQVFLDSPDSARCHGLRRVFTSGEALSPQLAQACIERLPAQLHNLYGPTEAAVDVTWWPCPQVGPVTQVLIGRPVANTQIYVLDQAGRLCVPGSPGEICIGGVQVGRGYWRRDELARDRFVPDPFGPAGARLYRTGDRGHWLPDGQLAYLGRRDFQLKLRGVRIELGEIESVLREQSGVREAVVMVRDQGNDRVLHAYVTGDTGQTADPQALRQRLRERLPEVMVPAVVIALAHMPLLPNGKLDRSALPPPRSPAAAPVLPGSLAASVDLAVQGQAAARTIASVWEDVLGHASFGGGDNFFDVGGHSLLLMRVHARLQAHFGHALALMDLFAHPNVEALAKHLTGQGETASAMPAPAAGPGLQVAVIGMACRVPGAADLELFWSNLLAGREGITRFDEATLLAAGEPPERVRDPRYVNAYGALDDADAFDAALFDVPRTEAEILDPQQRVFLECAWAALEHAGYDPRGGPRACGVYAGVGLNTYALHHLYGRPDLMAERGAMALLLAIDKDFLAPRVAYKLDLRGPAISVQTACSTSLVAIAMAAQAIARGDCEMALAGGASVRFPQAQGHLYEDGMILSADGHTRSFDADASGVVFGSGVGAVLLKRLDLAISDGDTIHAVVEGAALNNDGASKPGFTAPSIEGQAQVIAAALASAGISPRAIGMLEAHGTGTRLGDPIELTALRQAWGLHTTDTGFCALGSVKANVGHLDAAAGVTGFIKAVLAVSRATLPPQIHFDRPNPALGLQESPFYVAVEPRPWPGDGPRRAAVSAFGIGGTNAHVILRQAPDAVPGLAPVGLGDSLQVIALSAATPRALEAASERLAHALQGLPQPNLAEVAYTLMAGRAPLAHRRTVVASSTAEAVAALRAAAAPAVVRVKRPEVVLLFPGFGSQYAGMAQALYAQEPAFRAVFDRGAAVVAAHAGINLHAVLQPEAGDLLRDPIVAQPAIVLVSCAIAQLWQSWGLRPAAVLGNSVGELSAACFAGVLSLDDALRFAVDRVRQMVAAAPGAMLAVPLSAQAIAAWLPESVTVAVHTSDDSVVVTGPAQDVAALQARLAAGGTQSRQLEGDLATHSPGMAAAESGVAQAFARVLRQSPRLPIVSNLSGNWFDPDTVQDPAYWARHVYTPVRLDLCLRTVHQSHSGACFLEVGPGRSLCSAVRANLGPDVLALASLAPREDSTPAPRFLRRTAAALWAAGVSLDPLALSGLTAPRRVPLPGYSFERQRLVVAPGTAVHSLPGVNALAAQAWLQWPTWERAAPLAQSAPPDVDRVLLVADHHGVAERLSGLLVAAGIAVQTCAGGDDYPTALGFLKGARSPALVHLASLDAGTDEARQMALSLHDPLALARALGNAGIDRLRVRLVSAGVHAVLGDEVLRPLAAVMAGPASTLGLEFPGLDCRWLDLPGPDPALASAVLAELSGDLESVVAYRAGARWQRRFAPVFPGARRAPDVLRAGGSYVVTGGLGAVGLELACAIAQAAPGARLVLMGRRNDPERRAEAARRLQSLGARCRVVEVDVADRATLALALADCGRVDGVVHAAGVPGGGIMGLRQGGGDPEEFGAKFDGARHLLAWAADHAPDFVLLCSSTSVHTGGFGSVAYTAANAALDALAWQAQAAGLPVLAVDWYRWQGMGMARETERLHLKLTGELLDDGLPAADARSLLAQLLAQRHLGVVAVCPVDLGTVVRQIRGNAAARWEAVQNGAAALPCPALHDAAEENLRTDTERSMAAIWREVLGAPRVGRDDGFSALGGDSLLALRMLGRIRTVLGITLPLREIFERPTLAELAGCVDALRALASPGETPDASSHEERGVI